VLVQGTVAVFGSANFILGAGALTVVLVVLAVAAEALSVGAIWFLAVMLVVLLVVASLGGYRVWSQSQTNEALLATQVAQLEQRRQAEGVPDEHHSGSEAVSKPSSTPSGLATRRRTTATLPASGR
jgi:lysylphosphatidylglycerol synthetase-like protein (DUF2156 family)